MPRSGPNGGDMHVSTIKPCLVSRDKCCDTSKEDGSSLNTPRGCAQESFDKMPAGREAKEMSVVSSTYSMGAS